MVRCYHCSFFNQPLQGRAGRGAEGGEALGHGEEDGTPARSGATGSSGAEGAGGPRAGSAQGTWARPLHVVPCGLAGRVAVVLRVF